MKTEALMMKIENRPPLLEFLNKLLNRPEQSIQNKEHEKDAGLVCYGCAHSAASAPFPSHPSGERPCCFCVRNPEREEWAKGQPTERDPKPDNEGTLRDFNPFAGNWYNGAPAVKVPMDCYTTLDMMDQERFFDEHPEYKKSVTTKGDNVEVVDD